jgi:hypothetical protein
MDGLGRVFNVVPVAADSPWVSLLEASAVTFVCVGANSETFTLTQARSSGGSGSTSLAPLDHYYKSTGSAGATAWTRDNAPTSGAVVTTTTANPVAVFTVHESELSDGFSHVQVTSSSSGTVFAITHDLKSQRAPANLPAVCSG